MQRLVREIEQCDGLRMNLLQSELDLHKRKCEEMKRNMAQLDKQCEKLMTQLRTAETELKAAQNENESLKKEMTTLNGQWKKRTEEENASQRDRSKWMNDKVTFLEVSKMEAQLRQQETDLRAAQSKLEQCEKENSSLREQMDKMQEEGTKTKQENIILRQNFPLNDQLYELRADLEQKEKLIAYLQSVVQPKQMQKLPRHRSSLLSDGNDLSEIEMEYKQCLQLEKERNQLKKNLESRLRVLDEKQNEVTPTRATVREETVHFVAPSTPTTTATYFMVSFHGRTHFGDEHGSVWVYRERPLTSLAEACDRFRETVQLSLGGLCRVQLLNTVDFRLSSRAALSVPFSASISSLATMFSADDPTIAYIGVSHVEPYKAGLVDELYPLDMANCLVGKLGNKSRALSRSRCELSTTMSSVISNTSNNNSCNSGGVTFGLTDDECGSSAMTTEAMETNSTNNHTAQHQPVHFVFNERQTDITAGENTPELARMILRRIMLTVESPFSGTRRRRRVVRTEETLLSPLELACENILQKATQIRHILSSAGLRRCRHRHCHHRLVNCGYDKSALKRVDVKQLQLFLQGAIMPTVNAGLLAYAETFTAPTQQKRYGNKGLIRLWNALKTLLDEVDEAMRVNEATMGTERREYQLMLRNAYENTVEKLNRAFARSGSCTPSREKRRSMSTDPARRSSNRAQQQSMLIKPIFAL